jgi:pimeloyl-ACP methyl ester carboxylesterase
MANKIIRYIGYFIGGILTLIVGLSLAWYRSDIAPEELEPAYFTAESSYVNVLDSKLHIRKRGSGEVIFLIHGSFASLHTWDAWEKVLSKSYTTISMDLPGHGLTGPTPSGHYSTDDYEKLIIALADQLKIDSFSIAGNSMGGAVAVKIALRNPQRVKKLILVDAAGFSHLNDSSQLTTPFLFKLLQSKITSQLLTKITPRFLFEMNLKQVYGDPSKIKQEDITRFYELMRREGNRGATVERLRNPGKNIQDSIKYIQAPTLILWGAKDQWTPLAYAHQFKEAIKTSRLIIYPNAGHIPMEEIPEETGAAVLDFLKE